MITGSSRRPGADVSLIEMSGGPSGRPLRSEFRTSPRTSAARASAALVSGPAPGTRRPIAPPSKRSKSSVGTTTTWKVVACASPTSMVRNAKARAMVRAMPGTLGSLASAEPVRAALIAAAVALPLSVFGPPGGDLPAHLYRTMLVEDGVFVWDNLWYGGHYPLASYSLLYYLPATLFGNTPLAVGAVIGSAALFASICGREWGALAVWPARVFAVLASGPIFTGTYTYALGLLALLGAIRALQAGRLWLSFGAAALCLGFSPLAYAFLCIAFAAVGLTRGRLDRKAVAVGAALAFLGAVQATAIWVFPHDAVYPFRLLELGVVLAVSLFGAALA